MQKPSADILSAFDQINVLNFAPIIVAVSGGSDSTALLLGLRDYIADRQIDVRIIAVTIDHGLRAGSDDEANQVGDLCTRLGIDHIIKKWRSGSINSAVQASAREARYDLLAQVARDNCAQYVLTGHTLNDQLETIAMRSQRGEGRGLAGIPKATLFNRSVWFVRPFLKLQRDDLRHFLKRNHVNWIDDPSNDNEAFERVRIRHHEFSESEKNQILGVQKQAEQLRLIDAENGAAFLADESKFGQCEEVEQLWLNLEFRESDGFQSALQVVLCKVGHKQHFASQAVIDQLMGFVMRGKNAEKFTAHGCLLSIIAGKLVVEREVRAKTNGQFCYDYLVPVADYTLANALSVRLAGINLPLSPIKAATR